MSEDGGAGLADLAGLRRGTYGLLGSLFLYPDDEHIEQHAALAGALERQSELARDFPFFPRWRSLLEALAGLTDEARAELEEVYLELFLLGDCPLYESAHLDPSGRQRGVIASEVERAYAAAGATLDAPVAGELPDHAAFELEFVSLLCGEEARAWRGHRPAEAAEWLRAERAFLDDHLLRWLPALAGQVSRAATPASFYGLLAEAARAFVVHDRDLIGALERA